MRVSWIHPTTRTRELEALWERMERHLARIAFPSTRVEIRFPKRSGNFGRSLYAEHLNSVHMVEDALQAEREGADAVVFGCWNDPLWEAREVLRVPVASVGEQSMLHALSLGYRFAVVTVAPKVVPGIEKDLRLYGLEPRAIARPVRSIDPPSDAELLIGAVRDPHDEFIPRFERAARACIADGAEVILVGCGYYGPLLGDVGYREIPGTGVPVVNASAVAFKQAETMAALADTVGLGKSTAGYFRPPPAGPLGAVRAALSLGGTQAERQTLDAAEDSSSTVASLPQGGKHGRRDNDPAPQRRAAASGPRV